MVAKYLRYSFYVPYLRFIAIRLEMDGVYVIL